jgi:hypothetical protein
MVTEGVPVILGCAAGQGAARATAGSGLAGVPLRTRCTGESAAATTRSCGLVCCRKSNPLRTVWMHARVCHNARVRDDALITVIAAARARALAQANMEA